MHGIAKSGRVKGAVLLCLVLLQGVGAQQGAAPSAREIFPGGAFTFCRVQYSGGGGWGWGRGGSWRVDYPESDRNFSLRLSQLTTIEVERAADGGFAHAVVRLDQPELFDYPFIYMLEVGGLALGQTEREGLAAYLKRGGFLMVDDFWGDDEWDNWEYEIGRVLPPEEYPLVEVPPDHEIFNIVFELDGLPQVPAAGNFDRWQSSGITYEGSSGRYAQYGTGARCMGIFDGDGRLMLVALHNTDLGDGWEREGENYGYFAEFSAKRAYPMGINIVVYAMTH